MASPTYNSNIAGGAFLPAQGMSFAGAGNSRVYDWKTFRSLKGGVQHPVSTQLAAGRNSAGAAADNSANSAGTAAATATSPQTVSPQSVSGAGAMPTIAGGLLRPGSIDQSQFKAMLAAASAGASGAAGSAARTPLMPAATGRSPLASLPPTPPLSPAAALAAQQVDPTGQQMAMATGDAAPGPQMGGDAAGGASIPTLTAAQFAALTGSPLPAGMNGTAAAGMATGGAVTGGVAMQAANANQSAATGLSDIPADALTMTDASIPPDGPEAPAQVAGKAAGDASVADVATRKRPKSIHGTTDENGVLLVTHIDRDTRREYEAKGIKWKLVDDPEADRLFFGEDGKLGWDDVIDLINPLQHIPLVNVLYRKLTGDKINGAAELLGAIPFGPFSTLSAITNIAVREASGRDVGANVIAMITGEDKQGDGAAAQDLAQRDPGATETAATEAGGTQTSAAAIDPLANQTAGLPGIRDRNNGRA